MFHQNHAQKSSQKKPLCVLFTTSDIKHVGFFPHNIWFSKTNWDVLQFSSIFWLCWVFLAQCRLSLAAASGGYSLWLQ